MDLIESLRRAWLGNRTKKKSVFGAGMAFSYCKMVTEQPTKQNLSYSQIPDADGSPCVIPARPREANTGACSTALGWEAECSPPD